MVFPNAKVMNESDRYIDYLNRLMALIQDGLKCSATRAVLRLTQILVLWDYSVKDKGSGPKSVDEIKEMLNYIVSTEVGYLFARHDVIDFPMSILKIVDTFYHEVGNQIRLMVEAYDCFLDRVYFESGEFQPVAADVFDFMLQVLNPGASDKFICVASDMGTNALRAKSFRNNSDDVFYLSSEETARLARFRLLLHGMRTGVPPRFGFLRDAAPLLDTSADCMTIIPPLGRWVHDGYFGTMGMGEARAFADVRYIASGIERLKRKGKLAFVISEANLDRPESIEFKRSLLKYCDIRAIFSLPFEKTYSGWRRYPCAVVFAQKKNAPRTEESQDVHLGLLPADLHNGEPKQLIKMAQDLFE